MCLSMGVTIAMVGLGAGATAVTLHSRAPAAVPATFAYFTLMEGLQGWGYTHLDACGLPENQLSALLSYLHISFQPFFINAFAMALAASRVATPMRVAVWIGCGMSAVAMLLQVYPFAWAGSCIAGQALCGEALCTLRGTWHLGWAIPYTDIIPPLRLAPDVALPFPSYMLAAFGLPLLYGAWRFALFHLLAGPGLAALLTNNPYEMPAVWCLFSIALVSVWFSPWLRRQIGGAAACGPGLRGGVA
ncbi:DUF5765 domain-containing protein [Falsiroseomonas oryziterrae]|uniref:DUF5765 domain-containing protein n=1 Tax=Falsiroseomonas oryziterrae TaxID=2911368 RepID=UPI001F2BA6C3|nr:DUF5765 domain-containing protein [Roseomonas sp. NPKOSM-4]